MISINHQSIITITFPLPITWHPKSRKFQNFSRLPQCQQCIDNNSAFLASKASCCCCVSPSTFLTYSWLQSTNFWFLFCTGIWMIGWTSAIFKFRYRFSSVLEKVKSVDELIVYSPVQLANPRFASYKLATAIITLFCDGCSARYPLAKLLGLKSSMLLERKCQNLLITDFSENSFLTKTR